VTFKINSPVEAAFFGIVVIAASTAVAAIVYGLVRATRAVVRRFRR
jgi:hypothetical protein